ALLDQLERPPDGDPRPILLFQRSQLQVPAPTAYVRGLARRGHQVPARPNRLRAKSADGVAGRQWKGSRLHGVYLTHSERRTHPAGEADAGGSPRDVGRPERVARLAGYPPDARGVYGIGGTAETPDATHPDRRGGGGLLLRTAVTQAVGGKPSP